MLTHYHSKPNNKQTDRQSDRQTDLSAILSGPETGLEGSLLVVLLRSTVVVLVVQPADLSGTELTAIQL